MADSSQVTTRQEGSYPIRPDDLLEPLALIHVARVEELCQPTSESN